MDDDETGLPASTRMFLVSVHLVESTKAGSMNDDNEPLFNVLRDIEHSAERGFEPTQRFGFRTEYDADGTRWTVMEVCDLSIEVNGAHPVTVIRVSPEDAEVLAAIWIQQARITRGQ